MKLTYLLFLTRKYKKQNNMRLELEGQNDTATAGFKRSKPRDSRSIQIRHPDGPLMHL